MNDIARDLMRSGGDVAALNEVRDAGAILYRLADAVKPAAAPAAFSGIALQVIDLGRPFDPLDHPRGKHGKFVKKPEGSGIAEQFARAVGPAMARQSRGGFASALGPAMAGRGGTPGPEAGLEDFVRHMREQHPEGDQPVAHKGEVEQLRSDVAGLEARMKGDIERLEHLNKEAEEEEKEKRRAELTLEILAIVAGAAVIFFFGGGVIGAAAVLPFVVNSAIEHGPNIIRSIGVYHVVGKGRGRSWLAHPIKAPHEAAKTAAPKLRSKPSEIAQAMRRPRQQT